jgi:23S rRNA (guanosine2251-2'-O)-methyltransferase
LAKSNTSRVDEDLLYGFHAVIAALKNPNRKALQLLVTRNANIEIVDNSTRFGYDLPLNCEILTSNEIADILPAGAIHQGIALKVSSLSEFSIDKACEGTNLIVVLDQVTDPHNFGAILRSAAAFRVGALITTRRHSPSLGGVLAKAASGGLEWVKIAKVINLVRAMEKLKNLGFEVIGLDDKSDLLFPNLKIGPRVALVFGAESIGLRFLTRKHCDILARLPTTGEIKSLNVSNAAAIALYEVAQQSTS